MANAEPAEIDVARPFFDKYAAAFIEGLETNRLQAKRDFEAIIAISKPPDFSSCLDLARSILLGDRHHRNKRKTRP